MRVVTNLDLQKEIARLNDELDDERRRRSAAETAIKAREDYWKGVVTRLDERNDIDYHELKTALDDLEILNDRLQEAYEERDRATARLGRFQV